MDFDVEGYGDDCGCLMLGDSMYLLAGIEEPQLSDSFSAKIDPFNYNYPDKIADFQRFKVYQTLVKFYS